MEIKSTLNPDQIKLEKIQSQINVFELEKDSILDSYVSITKAILLLNTTKYRLIKELNSGAYRYVIIRNKVYVNKRDVEYQVNRTQERLAVGV